MNEAHHYELTNMRKVHVGVKSCRLWSIYNRGPEALVVDGKLDPFASVARTFIFPGCIRGFYSRPTVKLHTKGSASISVVSYDVKESK